MRVGVYDNLPKIGRSASGQPEGIFIDILKAIADAEQWSVQYVPGTWAEGLDRLSKGEIDLMPDVALTQARESQYAFHHDPVLSDWFQVYAPRGSGIRSVLDLNGKRVSLLEGSIQQDAFMKSVVGFDMKVSLKPMATYDKAFAALARGDVDAVITNRFYGAAHMAKQDLQDTAIIFNPTRLFFAAPRSGDGKLLAAIDRHLERFKADPGSVYYRALQKWTSEETTAGVPIWMKALATTAVALMLLGLSWSLALKRQVAARTADLAHSNAEIQEALTKLEGAQKQLSGLNADLERRVAERTEELRVARDRAEEADRIKSAFLATMSHELRTPLNSIIGFTGLLLQGLAGPLNPEQSKQLGMVRTSARHLLALINDVLDISKIEAGQLKVSCEPFSLRESIEKTLDIARPMADKKGLELRTEIEGLPDQMISDPRRVEQILINLLNNAVKFTESGTVTLGAAALGDTSGDPSGLVRMFVSDTGPGIRPEDVDSLFQPFHQVDTGLSRKHEGAGLGLAICRRLAQLLGGSIEVSSVWGKGSNFTVCLPTKGRGDP